MSESMGMGGSTDYLRSGGFMVPMVLVQPINRKDLLLNKSTS